MENNKSLKEKEIQENADFFYQNLNTLLKEHNNQYVVIKNKNFIEYFSTFEEAYEFALEKYNDEIFSIQYIIEKEKTNIGLQNLF